MREIRDALRKEISEALNEPYSIFDIKILEIDAKEGTYIIKGIFKATPLFSSVTKRGGKFEAELDEDLKIISLKITEEK
jgi:hypothetical protein